MTLPHAYIAALVKYQKLEGQLFRLFKIHLAKDDKSSSSVSFQTQTAS